MLLAPSPKFHVTRWVSSTPGSVKLPLNAIDCCGTVTRDCATLTCAVGVTLVPMIVIESLPDIAPSSVAWKVTTYVPSSSGVKANAVLAPLA